MYCKNTLKIVKAKFLNPLLVKKTMNNVDFETTNKYRIALLQNCKAVFRSLSM